MLNIRILKEKALELKNTDLSPLEKVIVTFFNQDDYGPLMSHLESYSDSEAFEIFRQVLNEDSPEGVFFIQNKELSITNDRLDIFLIGRNIQVKIEESELNFLSEFGKDTINLILKTEGDKIIATVPNKVSFKKHFNEALEKISSIVKDQPITWQKAPKMMAVAILGLSLSACAKAVYKEPGSNLTPNPPPISQPGTPGEDSPTIIETKNIIFANHADPSTNDELYSHHTIDDNKKFTLPETLMSYTFQDKIHLPTLNVFVNEEYVCSYISKNQEYEAHATCIRELDLVAGDKLIIKGIPAGETITLKFIIE